MKKQLIATVVGGLLLFIWQFLSFAAINFHKAESKYTPNQDKIIEALAQNLTEDGQYFLPQAPPGSTSEQQKAVMENSMGKPWATINYHASMDMSMGGNMARAFLIDLIAAFLLTWLLLKLQVLTFQTALFSSLAVGFMAYLTIPYLSSIWYETSSVGYLIDVVGEWGLIGVWLGWWLTKK
jgi:Flp pilus assembly protein TadB